MKRLMVALLVGGAVFGTVWAAAATLDVDGGTLQMSTAVDAVCDGNGVELGYIFSDPNPGNGNFNEDVVDEAQVSGIANACIGDQLTVELFADLDSNGLDEGDTICAAAEGTIVSTGDPDNNHLFLDMNPGNDVAGPCTVLQVIAAFVNIDGQAVWP